MLIVTGSIEARPDTIDRILELGLAHVRRSRQEQGCLLHSIHRDVENDLRVVSSSSGKIPRRSKLTSRPLVRRFVREAAALPFDRPNIDLRSRGRFDPETGTRQAGHLSSLLRRRVEPGPVPGDRSSPEPAVAIRWTRT